MSELSLVEFLTARLDDDEAVAWGGAPSPWTSGGWDGGFEGPREVLDRHGDVTARTYYGGTHGHVLRFDPTRVLAEVEAKRRIVELHLPMDELVQGKWFCGECGSPDDWNVTTLPDEYAWPCDTLRLLASVYSDHPDYREEWKP